MPMSYLLLLVVLIEGFTTLAMQMVALRHAIPLVGSSIILTSVVIGVILLALAVGYWTGGKLTSRLKDKQVAHVLSWFLFASGVYYVILVFPFQERFLVDFVQQFPYVIALFLFSLLFFFIPVVLASHTMPMITELTKGNKGFAAGKILFVSTLGSFVGSILTSTVLFSRRGVTLTGYVIATLLILCHILMMAYLKRIPWAGIIVLVAISWFSLVKTETSAVLVEYDSPYQHIVVREDVYGGSTFRTMLLNGGFASSIETKTGESWFGYIREAIQATDMRATVSSSMNRKNILVIGAAGFTYPEEMAQREYVGRIDTIDVDPAVKTIAETYFQQKPLHEKIHFTAQSARGYIRESLADKKRYDYTLVDAYIGTSIPEELITHEFFTDLAQLSEYVMLNMIMDTKMDTEFSHTLMNTLLASWPDGVWYKYVSSGDRDLNRMGNFLIASRAFSGAVRYQKNSVQDTEIYKDDKHDIEIDKAEMFYGEGFEG